MTVIKIIGTILFLLPSAILAYSIMSPAVFSYGPVGGFLFAAMPLLYCLYCIKVIYHFFSLKLMSFFIKLEPGILYSGLKKCYNGRK